MAYFHVIVIVAERSYTHVTVGRPKTRQVDYIKPLEQTRNASSRYQARRGRALVLVEKLDTLLPFMQEVEELTKEHCIIAIQKMVKEVLADV